MKRSVIYRTSLSERDYDEAIKALQDAKQQPEHLSDGCAVCYDSGHTAEQCHHNPLVMARRSVAALGVWRCFHCDAVFTDVEKAQEHFGTRETDDPKCKSDAVAAAERKGRIEAKELKAIRDALGSALAGVWDGHYSGKGVEVAYAQSVNTQVVNALKTLDRLEREDESK